MKSSSQKTGSMIDPVPTALPSDPSSGKENITPLMKQYEQLKVTRPDEILFFRLGDFYEMFGEDAKAAAPILEVVLTQRQGVPMCGVPYHAMERYVSKLLKKGLRVAIAEQMEDPAVTKGIVKRDIIRTISAGTIIEENLLAEKTNNFLLAVSYPENEPDKKGRPDDSPAGLAAVDISTGQLILTEIEPGPGEINLANEIERIRPAEILLPQGKKLPESLSASIPCQWIDPDDPATLDSAPSSLIWKDHPRSAKAAGMLYAYLKKMNPGLIQNIQTPKFVSQSDTMQLDQQTIDNLELLNNSDDGSMERTLLHVLDRTLTPMGGRLLRQWVVRPLVRLDKIQERIRTVEYLLQESSERKICRDNLKGIFDFERIVVRIASGNVSPRDLIGLKLSLIKVENIKTIFYREEKEQNVTSSVFSSDLPKLIHKILSQLGIWQNLISLIGQAIAVEPPVHLDEGGVIREGYNSDLDEKRKAVQEGKLWLQALENKEKENTRIPTLKIGYTSVFGYYFEITKPHLSKVPPNWHRKQTLINVERFVNEELKDLEQKILGAEEQCLRIERELFHGIIEKVKGETRQIQESAGAIGNLDCLLAFSELAEIKSLCKPKMTDSDLIDIREGWHPVVQEFLPPGMFVPNDTQLNRSDNQIIILTGPNMSGKSTYLRQAALIVLMAQIGSYVPAKECEIGAVDRIFTRIGSGDRLAQGKSTFMVEMQETARIFSEATSKSLVILDEVGRGTSTYDGISIAWAVIEQLVKEPKPKVLFATHYFELTHLAGENPAIKNYNVQAKEWGDSVIFLHKIAPGPADRSYGIHVAQLAGLPSSVIQRAKKILIKLEKEHRSILKSKEELQQDLFE